MSERARSSLLPPMAEIVSAEFGATGHASTGMALYPFSDEIPEAVVEESEQNEDSSENKKRGDSLECAEPPDIDEKDSALTRFCLL